MVAPALANSNVKLVGELARIVLAKIAAGQARPSRDAGGRARLSDDAAGSEVPADASSPSSLEREPLLAASVLKTAMSAAHAGRAVKTLDQAVSALGMDKLKSLIIEFMTRELFTSANPRIQAATKHVWEHSVAVAMLARDIAAMTTGANSDTCYLAGLLHDVGKPVLAAMMLEAEKMLGKDKAGLARHRRCGPDDRAGPSPGRRRAREGVEAARGGHRGDPRLHRVRHRESRWAPRTSCGSRTRSRSAKASRPGRSTPPTSTR